MLFIIIDQSPSYSSSIDITINFNQSSDSPSSIDEIRLGIIVSHSNFTINNQSSSMYTPYDIPVFLWKNSTGDPYDLIDVVQIENNVYETDTSLCKWTDNQWNRLLNGNMSSNVSYAYFLKTINSQLIFTLIDTSNISSLLSPPSPYLNILYCIPYKLGVTELVLIVCFSVLFIVVVIVLLIFHYFKGGEDNRTHHFERYHSRGKQDKTTNNQSKELRHRKRESVSTIEEPIDQKID